MINHILKQSKVFVCFYHCGGSVHNFNPCSEFLKYLPSIILHVYTDCLGGEQSTGSVLCLNSVLWYDWPGIEFRSPDVFAKRLTTIPSHQSREGPLPNSEFQTFGPQTSDLRVADFRLNSSWLISTMLKEESNYNWNYHKLVIRWVQLIDDLWDNSRLFGLTRSSSEIKSFQYSFNCAYRGRSNSMPVL